VLARPIREKDTLDQDPIVLIIRSSSWFH